MAIRKAEKAKPIRKARRVNDVIGRAGTLHAGDFLVVSDKYDQIQYVTVNENEVKVQCKNSGWHDLKPRDKIEIGRNLNLSKPSKIDYASLRPSKRKRR